MYCSGHILWPNLEFIKESNYAYVYTSLQIHAFLSWQYIFKNEKLSCTSFANVVAMKTYPPISVLLLVVCLLLVPFLYTSTTLDPVLTIKHLVAGILVLGINVSMVLEMAKVKPEKLRVNLVVAELLLLIIGLGLLSAINATNQSEAFFDVLRWVFLLNIFWVIHMIRTVHGAYVFYLERAIALLSSIVALGTFYLFISAYSQGNYNHQASYGITFTFAHRNLLSQVLLLVSIVQFLGFQTLPKAWKRLCVVNLVLTVPMLILLFVRSVWLASAMAATVIVLLSFVLQWRKKGSGIKKPLLWTGVGAVALVAGVLAIPTSDTQQTLSKQTHFIENQDYGSSGERLQLWTKSLDLVGPSPVLGIGGGNWKIEIPKTRLENMRSDEGNLFFQRPHNDFVWILTENGITGLLLFIALLAVAFSSMLKASLNGQAGSKFIFATAALAAYCVIAFFSFPKERMVHLLLFCILLAAIPGTKQVSSKAIRASFLVLIPLSILYSYAFYERFHGEKGTKTALFERDNGNSIGVTQSINASIGYWNTLDNTGTPLKWYSGSAHYLQNNMLEALDDFRMAYLANPNHVHVMNNLASVLVHFNETAEAKKLYLKAFQQAPEFMDPLINLTAVHYNEAHLDSAAQFLQMIDTNTLHPSYPVFVETVCESILLNEIEKAQGPVRSALVGINTNTDWRRSVFRRSIVDGVSFTERLETEVAFILE